MLIGQGTQLTEGRGISGICFKLIKSSGAYSWVHKGHKSVKTSTAKAEYISLIEECLEAIHFSGILEDVGRFFCKLTLKVLSITGLY